MIRKEIEKSDRKLVTLESNLEWLNKFKHLETDRHKLYHVPATNEDTDETGNRWIQFMQEHSLNDFEIVFIDSSPWSSRTKCFEHFLDRAKIILFHDFD
jgi:hypothetical protein